MNEDIRQALHLLFGLFFVFFVLLTGTKKALFLLLILSVTGLIASFLMIKGIRIPIAFTLLRIVERMDESSFPGKAAFRFLAGIGIVLFYSLLVERPEIAAPALIPIALGDSFATIIGTRIGRIPLLSKSLEGSIAFFIASMTAYYLLFPKIFFQGIIVSLTALMAELLPLEDNITVPFVSAVTLSFLI